MGERISVALKGFVLLILVCLAGLAPSLMAQTAGTGALTGTVTDSTGAVVPNATVTVTSVDTGQARTATTGADGSYSVGLLTPGNYRVKFDAAGFQSVEVPSAKVTVTETAVLNQVMQVGAQTQEVTVQANVETVQTASSALGTVVNTQTVSDLPLNTRNYTNLLAMSAGANSNVSNASTIGKGSSLIAVNGGGDAQNTYLQDGVSVMNWYSFGTNTEGTEYGALAIPNPDTIAEFKIQTSSYDAGYGRNPGANVNVVTKSGTNDFHGTGFEFFRNAALNANDFFYKYSEVSAGEPNKQAVLNQNQFGGVFGGPIKKNKLFFFVSYQNTGQKNGLTGYGISNVTLPAIPNIARGTCTTPNWTSLSQCDANTAAFVTALANANCLSKPTAAGSIPVQGTTLGCTAPTNALSNINPVAINILQLQTSPGNYLIPSINNGAGGFDSIQRPAIFNDYQGLGNFDYVINANNTLSGRYDYETDPLNAQLPVINATLAGIALPGVPVSTTKTDHAGLLRLTTIVTPNLVNEARFSYQRYITNDNVNTTFTDTQVGITPLCIEANEACGKYGNDLSFFTIGTATSGFSFGSHYFYGVYVPENQFEYSDDVSWTHGKHSLRFGFEAQRIQADQNYPSIAIGAPTFATFSDFLIGRCAQGAAGCTNSNGGTGSNVTGGDGGSTAANGQFPFEFRDNNLDGYIQDDFKVSERLTLNIGVRWEYDGYLNEKYGNFANFWPTAYNAQPNPGTGCTINGTALGAGVNGTGCSLVGFVVPSNYRGPMPTGLFQNNNQTPTDKGAPYDNFAPRFGFAWQPLSTSKWVVRGGAGYFYDLLAGEDVGNPVTLEGPGPGIPVPTSTSASLQEPGILPATIPGPPGSFGFSPRWVNFPANPNSCSTTACSSSLDPHAISQYLRTPLTYEWNLNTQYEFLPTWVLELGYVGTHGIHQLAQSQGGAQGQASTEQYNWASLASTTNPINGITSNTSTNAVGRVPYLGLSPTDAWITSTDDYKFNSLQITLRKQLSHGLQMQAAYTWSRAFIGIPYGINTAPYVYNRYALNPNYRPQRLVVNYVWDLPLGHPAGMMGKVVEGWTVSGVTTFQDGDPLTITDSTGGTLFFGPAGGLSTGQFCPGMGNANVETSGSVEQRVVSGLQGHAGYLNGVSQGVFCAAPTGLAVNANFPIGTGTGFGNSGPGIVLGPGQNNWDMSLAKNTTVGGIREGATLQFRAEFFNTFNHPQFSNPALAVRTAATYGDITTSAVSPRVIQLALKYSF